MAGSSQTTTDHETIRKWAEERGARPAAVKDTGEGDDPGVIRLDFPIDGQDDRLEEISWEDFFAKFEENKLAFLYQDRKADGSQSNFFKFVKREPQTRP